MDEPDILDEYTDKKGFSYKKAVIVMIIAIIAIIIWAYLSGRMGLR